MVDVILDQVGREGRSLPPVHCNDQEGVGLSLVLFQRRWEKGLVVQHDLVIIVVECRVGRLLFEHEGKFLIVGLVGRWVKCK